MKVSHKQQHFIAMHNPITFSQLQSLMRHLKLVLMNYGFTCDIISVLEQMPIGDC